MFDIDKQNRLWKADNVRRRESRKRVLSHRPRPILAGVSVKKSEEEPFLINMQSVFDKGDPDKKLSLSSQQPPANSLPNARFLSPSASAEDPLPVDPVSEKISAFVGF